MSALVVLTNAIATTPFYTTSLALSHYYKVMPILLLTEAIKYVALSKRYSIKY